MKEVTKIIRKTGLTQYECIVCGTTTYSNNPMHIYKECDVCRVQPEFDISQEIWKSTVQSVRYEVSNFGRVRNRDTGRFLKPSNTNGYRTVSFYVSNQAGQKGFRVHRLVAEAFLPNPRGKPIVNHKDGNRSNNHVDNLEWCSESYNSQHAIHILGRSGAKPIRRTESSGLVTCYPNMTNAFRENLEYRILNQVEGGVRAKEWETKYEYITHEEYLRWANNLGLFEK